MSRALCGILVTKVMFPFSVSGRSSLPLLLPRLEPLRCRKVSTSLIEISLFRIGHSAIVVGWDRIWVEPDRFGKVADRLFVLCLFPVGDSAMEEGRDKI